MFLVTINIEPNKTLQALITIYNSRNMQQKDVRMTNYCYYHVIAYTVPQAAHV